MHRHLLHWISVALLSVTAAGGLGCGDDDDDVPINRPDGSAGADGSAGDGGSTVDAGVLLTDSQIATVLHIANQAEIREAELAMVRAVNEDVREFAQTMIEDHTAADAALASLVPLSADGGILLVESGTSQMLAAEAALHDQVLALKDGAAFDLAYMTVQVAIHGELLQIIDAVLLPSTENLTLRAQLQTTRDTIAEHADRALEILNDLVAD